MTTRELAKEWALQNKESGRATNLSFKGTELISYETVIARMYYKKTKGLALFTTDFYSKTTTSHVNRAREACGRAGVYHFMVPNTNPVTYGDHMQNLSHIVATTYTDQLAVTYKDFFEIK